MDNNWEKMKNKKKKLAIKTKSDAKIVNTNVSAIAQTKKDIKKDKK